MHAIKNILNLTKGITCNRFLHSQNTNGARKTQTETQHMDKEDLGLMEMKWTGP